MIDSLKKIDLISKVEEYENGEKKRISSTFYGFVHAIQVIIMSLIRLRFWGSSLLVNSNINMSFELLMWAYKLVPTIANRFIK